jgi:branched-chain amino acid transport system permease protein
MSVETLGQFLISGVTSGSIYALSAIGFILIFNASNIVNFAQGEFVMLAGLIAATLYGFVQLPLWACVPLSVLIVAIVGIVFERLVIRPVRHAPILAQIMVTIGVSYVIKFGAMVIWGNEAKPLPAFSGETPVPLGGGVVIHSQTLWILAAIVLVLAGMQFFYRRTWMGKAMRACAINEQAAALSGISVPAMVRLSFLLGAGMGALGGVLIAPLYSASYDSGTLVGLKGFTAAIVGGFGNVYGAALGGLIVGIVESLSIGFISSGYKDAIAFVVLLLVLFLRPRGLIGEIQAERV